MNTDLKSLERRYGGPAALKILEEINRAEQRQFTFYRIPQSLKALHREMMEEEMDLPVLMAAGLR
jgi:hypothetical protein